MNTLTRLLAFSFIVVALPTFAADMNFESKENITLKQFQERINIYTEEEFDYEMHNIDLKE